MPFERDTEPHLLLDRGDTLARADVVRQLTADVVFEDLLRETGEEVPGKLCETILRSEATKLIPQFPGLRFRAIAWSATDEGCKALACRLPSQVRRGPCDPSGLHCGRPLVKNRR